MITVQGLTKRYGSTMAVHDLSFAVVPGRVTGFLGPNGAGKSTTMRMLLGLDTPNAGQALIGGRRYRSLSMPLRQVGALLDAAAVHGGRSARNHLRCIAATNEISPKRVPQVLEQTGLTEVARKRIRGFSLGMKQRLGIAAALLGDPAVLIFDEPINGLDPEGIHWIRNLMKSLASEGRTVFVSSHLMSEMALTADNLIVIGRGKLIVNTTVTEFIELSALNDILVRTPDGPELARLLSGRGASVAVQPDGGLSVKGIDLASVSDLAAEQRLRIYELTQRQASLEEAYLKLTDLAVQYRAEAAAGTAPVSAESKGEFRS